MPHHPTSLHLELAPSPWLARWLWGLHLLAAGSLLLTPLPFAAVAAGWGAVALGLAHGLRRHAYRTAAAAVVGVVQTAEGGWELRRRDGGTLPGRLLGDSFIHPRLVVLRFATARRRRQAVVLTADAVHPETLRRLRVGLRWGSHDNGAPP